MSNAKSKRQLHAQRQARLASGTCKECDQPRSQTLSGTLSVFCEDHRQQFARQTAKTRVTAPTIRYDADGDVVDIRDTPRFREYVRQIEGLMKIHPFVTTGLIHRTLGYERQRLTMLALEQISDLEECGAQPVRYRKFLEPRRLTLPNRHKPTIQPQTDRARPMAASFEAVRFESF